jgi:hypothetical protein
VQHPFGPFWPHFLLFVLSKIPPEHGAALVSLLSSLAGHQTAVCIDEAMLIIHVFSFGYLDKWAGWMYDATSLAGSRLD